LSKIVDNIDLSKIVDINKYCFYQQHSSSRKTDQSENTKINVLTMRNVQQHWNIYVQSHHVCINNTKYHIVGTVQKSTAKS
jgi:hypothetical protein